MNNISERDLLDFALRNDFESFLRYGVHTLNPGAPFLPNWHIRAIAYQLERIRRGEINRLIINMPPRHLKSITVSVAFPAFVLGHDPRQRIFSISYGSELTLKHARDFRSLVESSGYQRAFRHMHINRSTEDEVTTTLKGFRKATSVGGVLTGLGGNILILDDPQKPVDGQSKVRREAVNQWFTNTLMSRLDNKEKGAIIVVTQRVHMDDLSGYLMSGSGTWEILSLPAIAEVDERVQIGDNEFHHRRVGEALHPEHESLETLLCLKEDIGTYDFGAQYQQAPIPEGGAMLKSEWFRFYEGTLTRGPKDKVIQSWDPASKDGLQTDYSVCTTWIVRDKCFYLIDVMRARLEYPALKQAAMALAKRFKPTAILIEDMPPGTQLAQEMKAMGQFRVKPIPVEHDKRTRLFVQTAKFEAGLVYFPKDAAYMPDLLAELLAFPYGRHDDQVDSMTQALAYKLSTYTLDNI